MDNYDELWDSYFIPGTNVLKNNLGITDYKKLKQAEIDISFKKLVELHSKPIKGNFDKYHLRDIHKFIFEDIYPFAGEYRTVYMRKGNSYFTGEKDIDVHLDWVLKEMHEEFAKCKSYHDYIAFLAEYYYDLLVIHPFREGNGRSIREFLREFVLVHMPEYTLNFGKMDKESLEQAIEIAYMSKSMLEIEFSKALVLNENREINLGR